MFELAEVNQQAQQRIRELEAALAEAQDEVELKTIAANSMRVSMEQAQQRIRELEQALAKLQL